LSSADPFFTAVLTDSCLPGVPVNTSYLFKNLAALVQPPLLPLRHPASSPTPSLTKSITADEPFPEPRWVKVVPVYKGSAGAAYIKALSPEEGGSAYFGDGVGFPRSKIWKLGIKFEGTIEFPVAVEVGWVDKEKV